MRWHWHNVSDWPIGLTIATWVAPSVCVSIVWFAVFGWPQWQALQRFDQAKQKAYQEAKQEQQLVHKLRIKQQQLAKVPMLPQWQPQALRQYLQHFAQFYQMKWQRLEQHDGTWQVIGVTSYSVMPALQQALMRVPLVWQWHTITLQPQENSQQVRFEAALILKKGMGQRPLNWPTQFTLLPKITNPFTQQGTVAKKSVGYIQMGQQRYLASTEHGKWQLSTQRGQG